MASADSMNTSSAIPPALALAMLVGSNAAHPAPPAEPAGQCRFYSAGDMSAALGRKMKISIDSDMQCVYADTGDAGKTLVVQVASSKHESAQMKVVRQAEKIPNVAGEAYFDPDLFGFTARVGNFNVSVQTTILPMPRKEVIAIGTRITQALAGR
jgi:hypothetical protein